MGRGKIRALSSIQHDDASSAIHAEHKAEQRDRQGTHWIASPALEEKHTPATPTRDFSVYLGLGVQMRIEPSGKRVLLEGDQYVRELSSFVKARSFYWGAKKRKKHRKDGSINEWTGTAKIRCESVDRLTPTFAPWVCDYLYELCEQGHIKEVNEYLKRCTSSGVEIIQEETGRDVAFVSRHSDTPYLHCNYHSSYVSEGNFRKGDAHLRTLGDAFVGVLRKKFVGADSPFLQECLKRNLKKYRARSKIAGVKGRRAEWPLDALLAWNFDQIAEQNFGIDPAFEAAKKRYAAEVLGELGATLEGRLELVNKKRAALDAEYQLLQKEIAATAAAKAHLWVEDEVQEQAYER